MKGMVLPFPSLLVRAVIPSPATLAQVDSLCCPLPIAAMPGERVYGLCMFLLQKQRPFYLTFYEEMSFSMKAETFQETFLFASIPLILKVTYFMQLLRQLQQTPTHYISFYFFLVFFLSFFFFNFLDRIVLS